MQSRLCFIEAVDTEPTRMAGELRGVIGQLRRRLRQVDHAEVLTPSQSSVLNRLHRDGPAIQADLAAAEQVRQQSMAATLAALAELGHIERTPDPADRRRSLVTLSELGARTARGVAEHREEWLAGSLAAEFTADERQALDAALPLLRRLAQL